MKTKKPNVNNTYLKPGQQGYSLRLDELMKNFVDVATPMFKNEQEKNNYYDGKEAKTDFTNYYKMF